MIRLQPIAPARIALALLTLILTTAAPAQERAAVHTVQDVLDRLNAGPSVSGR